MQTKTAQRAEAAHMLRSGRSVDFVAAAVPGLTFTEILRMAQRLASLPSQERAGGGPLDRHGRPPTQRVCEPLPPEPELHVRQFLDALGTLQREAARLGDSVPAKLVRGALDTAKRWAIEL